MYIHVFIYSSFHLSFMYLFIHLFIIIKKLKKSSSSSSSSSRTQLLTWSKWPTRSQNARIRGAVVVVQMVSAGSASVLLKTKNAQIANQVETVTA